MQLDREVGSLEMLFFWRDMEPNGGPKPNRTPQTEAKPNGE
jgi:hypothetical protein